MKLNKPTKRILIMLIVLLLAVSAVVGSASAGENMVTNPNFSNGLNGWQKEIVGQYCDIIPTTEGGRSCVALRLQAGGYGQGGYVGITQTLDLSDVDTITLDIKRYVNNFTPENMSSMGRVSITDGYSTQVLWYFDWYNTAYTNWGTMRNFLHVPDGYKHSNVTLCIYFEGTTRESSSGLVDLFITNVVAETAHSKPTIESWNYWNADGKSIRTHGINLSSSPDGKGYANLKLLQYDTGGDLLSNCYLEVDLVQGGYVEYISGHGELDYTFAITNTGTYKPRFRLVNSYYASDWQTLSDTVVARMKINSAGAGIDPSQRFVTIGVSNIDFPSSWLYANPTYTWNFDYPNGSYTEQTTDTTIDYQYPTNAVKKSYNIGLSVVLTNNLGDTRTITASPFNDAIDLRDNTISFAQDTYSTGDTMRVNWDISAWKAQYPSNIYNLNLYLLDSGGSIDINNPDYSTTITGNSGGNDITAPSVAGYYLALIRDVTRNETVIATSSSASVVGYNNMTVQILADSAIYTEATTLSLYVGNSTDASNLYHRDGFTNPVTNITAGTYTFSQLPYGGASSTNTLKAETVGYSTITVTFTLPVQDNILKMDFVKGASEGGYTGGVGTAYASTFVTIRVIDVGTGMYQSGVQMTIQAKQATNPAEWFANLFGSAWGSTIAGTLQTGTTDSQGGATFAVFPNYRYQVDLSYNDRTWQYTFQPSTLVTEEVIRLDITEPLVGADKTDIINVDISSSKEDNKGFITVKYLDKSAKTTMLSIAVYEYIDGETSLATLDGTANPLIITESSYGGKIDEFTQVLTISRASGKSYIVSVEALSETFGLDVTKDVIKRSQAVEFNGMRIPIGNIPDGLYLVICFVVLVMLGAVGTQFNSRFYAIVVAVVGIFMLWAGWMGALGIVGEGACVVAFVLAILYYIATGNHPQ